MRKTVVCIALLIIATLIPSMSRAETIKIAHSIWVGYGPLFIAKEKGFFAKHGVDVELVKIEETKARFPAMLAGTVHMIASTVDSPLLYLRQPEDFKFVLALDESKGGDGIVSNKDIATVKDLKGKSVAFSEGSIGELFLSVLLNDAGLSFSDIKKVNMPAGEAGAAFVAQRVDAAVTYEPWLTRGKAAPHGHLLTDSSKTPGLITDVLIGTTEFVRSHPKEVAGIVRGWNDAIAFYESNPEEAVAIMAKNIGGWLKDPEQFKKTLTTVKYYNGAGNKQFFGTKDTPGPLYQAAERAIQFQGAQGRLKVKVTPDQLINATFVNQ